MAWLEEESIPLSSATNRTLISALVFEKFSSECDQPYSSIITYDRQVFTISEPSFPLKLHRLPNLRCRGASASSEVYRAAPFQCVHSVHTKSWSARFRDGRCLWLIFSNTILDPLWSTVHLISPLVVDRFEIFFFSFVAYGRGSKLNVSHLDQT